MFATSCLTVSIVGWAAAGLVVVRRRSPDAPAFRAPGHPFSAVLFVTLVLGVVTLVAITRPFQAICGFGIVVIGVVAYPLFARRHDS